MSGVPALGAIAVTGAFCALMLRSRAPELALLLSLLTGALLLWKSWRALMALIDLMDDLAAQAGLEGALVKPVFQTLGISILVRFAAQLCRDAGSGAAAVGVELAGSLAALAVVSPLVREVMELMGALL